MTEETEPVAGRKRTTAAPAAEVTPAGEAPPQIPDGEHPDDSAGREPGEIVLAMSPRQILGGFALLAGLILMLRRRRRDKG